MSDLVTYVETERNTYPEGSPERTSLTELSELLTAFKDAPTGSNQAQWDALQRKITELQDHALLSYEDSTEEATARMNSDEGRRQLQK